MLLAMLIIVLLSFVAGHALISMIPRLQAASQSSSWHEALCAAETGVDLGLGELARNSADLFQANWAETGWRKHVARNAGGTGEMGDEASGEMLKPRHPSGKSSLLTSDTIVRDNVWVNTLEGHRAMVDIQLTALWPDPGSDYENPRAPVWFRIRSFGTAALPGVATAGVSKMDTMLRRLSLQNIRPTLKGDDNLRQNIALPNVSRAIEVIARPIPRYPGALLARRGLFLPKAGNWSINSYYMTPDGEVKRTPYTGIGSVGSVGKPKGVPLVDAASQSSPTTSEGFPRINGDILVNGPARETAKNLPPQGNAWWNHYSVQEDGDRQLKPAERPSEYPETAVSPGRDLLNGLLGGSSSSSSVQTFEAGPADQPKMYVYKGNLGAFKVVPPSGGNAGSVIIVVDQDLVLPPGNTATGIEIQGNVKTQVFVQGDTIDLQNASVNTTGEANPLNLRIYGINDNTRLPESGGGTRTVLVNGSSNLNGTIYAPFYDVTSKGGGVGRWRGSIVANSIDLSGGGASEMLFPEGLLTDIESEGVMVTRYFEDYRQ